MKRITIIILGIALFAFSSFTLPPEWQGRGGDIYEYDNSSQIFKKIGSKSIYYTVKRTWDGNHINEYYRMVGYPDPKNFDIVVLESSIAIYKLEIYINICKDKSQQLLFEELKSFEYNYVVPAFPNTSSLLLMK